MTARNRFALTSAVLLALPVGLACRSFAQQHMETSSFNSAPARPPEDPKAVARGKAVYDKSCASCHGSDLRGTTSGNPNLLRSQPALIDKHGESLVPIMLGTAPDMSDHKIAVSNDEATAVAAYVRSVLAQIGSQGRPPGESSRAPNILVGDATQGQQYFTAHCVSCHSVDGDLKGIGKKISTPKALQSAWLRGTHLGVTPPPVTATVTQPGKPAEQGEVIHIDDFLLTLKLQDGSMLTVRRNGPVPKVVVHDPLEAHRNLLPTYSDKDIHDVTAYLVTLK